MWTGPGLVGTVWCSAEMPSWRAAVLTTPGLCNGFIRDPRVYLSIGLQKPFLQMKNLRSPSLTPQAVKKLYLVSPGFNSHSALCQLVTWGKSWNLTWYGLFSSFKIMESNVCVGVADKRGEAAYLRSISSKLPQILWTLLKKYCLILTALSYHF